VDWHVSDAARQLLANARTAARDRLDGVRPFLAVHRRVVLLVSVGLVVVVVGAAVAKWAIPGPEGAPDNEFIGFYCPDCRFFFQVSHREFERTWEAGRYRVGSDKRTLLYPCPRCEKLTAHRTTGPPPASGGPGAGGPVTSPPAEH